MSRTTVWVSAIAAAFAFAGGFLLANALNRGELDLLKSEKERLRAISSETSEKNSELNLSSDEINARIAEADRNPDNFQYQKNLGLALYRYAAMKKDAELLRKAIPLLTLAHRIEKADYDVIVGLGNSHFDVGFFANENESFARSREYYGKALDLRPNDADVRTDFGLTFFLQQPPDYDLAIAEFKKALKISPKRENTLEFTIQTLLKQNKNAEANEYLEKLRAVNPDNPSLTALSSEIVQAKQ